MEASGPRGFAVEATTIREPDLDARGLRTGLAEPGGATVTSKAGVHMAWSGSREVLAPAPAADPAAASPTTAGPSRTAIDPALRPDVTVPDWAPLRPSAGTGPEPAKAQKPATAGAQEPETAGAQEPATAGAREPETAGAQEPATAGAQEPATAGAREPETAGAREPETAGAREPAADPGPQDHADSGPHDHADPGPRDHADSGPASATAASALPGPEPSPREAVAEVAEPAEPAPRPELPPAPTIVPEERTVRVAVDRDLAIEVATRAEGVVDVTLEGNAADLGDLGPSLRDALALGGWTLGTYRHEPNERPALARSRRSPAEAEAATSVPTAPPVRRGHLLDTEV